LTDDDMKLRRAVGANRTVRAQLKAETFSGNSESTGAIHWIEKNTAPDPKRGTRRETAMVLIDSTKASVTKTKVRAEDEQPDYCGESACHGLYLH